MINTKHLISYSRRIEPVNLLDFLATDDTRIYWEYGDLAFAGCGVAIQFYADSADRFEIIRREIQELFAAAEVERPHPLVMPRLFGGFSFQANFTPDSLWQSFSPAYFILPRYLLTRIGKEVWLTVNTYDDHTAEIELPRQKNGGETKQTLNFDVDYPLPLKSWREQINNATQRMKNGELQKVVLSRSCDLIFDTPVNPLNALAALGKKYPETYRFLIEPTAGNAFFGASPELLVKVDGNQFSTVALAGSIKRGTTLEEDEKFARQLMANPKEIYEHQLVVNALRQTLLPLTRELTFGEMGVYKLKNIQHLHTPVAGQLHEGLHVLDLVQALHPTPALGGTPRDIAMETIRQTELISRGWYASPVGWIDAQGGGTFAVAIRSAVAKGKRARLYAGAGIVAESDPDREWEETRLKFRPMLDALGIKEQAFLSI